MCLDFGNARYVPGLFLPLLSWLPGLSKPPWKLHPPPPSLSASPRWESAGNTAGSRRPRTPGSPRLGLGKKNVSLESASVGVLRTSKQSPVIGPNSALMLYAIRETVRPWDLESSSSAWYCLTVPHTGHQTACLDLGNAINTYSRLPFVRRPTAACTRWRPRPW